MGRPPNAFREQEDIRPPVRGLSDRDRAAARIAELREQRSAIPEHNGNEFDIDPSKVPEGWEYQWKRHTTWGKDIDSGQYLTMLDRYGWKPVPRSRHPEEMPLGNTEETITRKGQILMEIPKQLADESRNREKHEADRAVNDKKESLGEARTDLEREGGKRANINATYETRAPIPNE